MPTRPAENRVTVVRSLATQSGAARPSSADATQTPSSCQDRGIRWGRSVHSVARPAAADVSGGFPIATGRRPDRRGRCGTIPSDRCSRCSTAYPCSWRQRRSCRCSGWSDRCSLSADWFSPTGTGTRRRKGPSTPSFDHLVGAGEQCWRHSEAEHPAVWALMTSSSLLDCTTGRSAGLAPLRMRPA